MGRWIPLVERSAVLHRVRGYEQEFPTPCFLVSMGGDAPPAPPLFLLLQVANVRPPPPSLLLHLANVPNPPPPLHHHADVAPLHPRPSQLILQLAALRLLVSPSRLCRGHRARPRQDAQPGRCTTCSTNCSGRQPRSTLVPSTASSLRSPVLRPTTTTEAAPLSSSHSSTACTEKKPPAGGASHSPHLRHPHGLLLPRSSRFFGCFLRTGLRLNRIFGNTLLKCLCYAKWTDDAVDVLLRKMSELGCAPDAISYNTVLKRLCEDSRSQEALNLLYTMAKEGCA
ncbi:hypothetical protein ACQ4PT_008129 [Festuca glaucescens]